MQAHRVIAFVQHAVLRAAVAIMALAIVPTTAAQEAMKSQTGLRSVEAVGTSFVVTLQSGRVLHSPDLVGAVLSIVVGDATVRLRIVGIERDPLDKRPGVATEDAVWLHSLSVEGPDGAWRNMCQPGPDGRTQGFPLAGQSAPDATMREAAPGVFELVCSAGAQGKCVRFGYRPWAGTPDGTPLRAMYNACVHMVRGDYAGENSPKTRNGMLIDIFDSWNIQESVADPAMVFVCCF